MSLKSVTMQRAIITLLQLAVILSSAACALAKASTVELDQIEAVASSPSVHDGGHRCAHDGSRVWCWGVNAVGQLGQDHMIDLNLATIVTGLEGASQRFRPGIAALAVGARHSCAVKNQRVNCWGSNESGQLGTGDQLKRLKPQRIFLPPPSTGDFGENIETVGAGANHTCAQASGGASWCWGNNQHGQVGRAPESGSEQPVPVSVSVGRVEQWALGDAHTCHLSDGEVWCWGANAHGQLGDGTLESRHSAARVEGLPDSINRIVAGPRHVCASNGESVYCWGANDRAQAGLASTADDPDSQRVTLPVRIHGLNGEVVDLALARTRSCAALDHEVWCWGSAGFGAPDDPVAVFVWQADGRITALPDEACALSDKRVNCVNGSGLGQWASPHLAHRVESLPLLPQEPTTLPRLFVGAHNACAVLEDNRLFCWGNNAFGQLGQSDTAAYDSAVEIQLPEAPDILDLSIGKFHICASTDAGLYCWGSNFFKALGIDDSPNSATPLLAPILTTATARLASGFGYNCLWEPATAEPLRCWGLVLPGMAVHAPSGQSTVADPFEIAVPGLLQSVEAGHDHLCMLASTEDGSDEVFCIGDIPTTPDYADLPAPARYQLRRVETGLDQVDSIQAAAFSHCALGNSKVACWGMDHASNEGTRGRPRSPVLVQFPDDINPEAATFSFAAGGRHVCALDDSGYPQCIGLPLSQSCNYAVATGEIGPGSGVVGCSLLESELSPAERNWMPLAGLPASPVKQLKSGGQYSCSMQGPFVYCWGWGEAVTVQRGHDNGQVLPVLRSGSIEPSATASLTLDTTQSCPGFLLARTRLLDADDAGASGSWGMEMLLRDGDTRLHGGLNFGGFARLRESGYAAFRIDNGGQGPQQVSIEADGNGDRFVLEISSSVPVGSPQETVFTQEVILDGSLAPIEVELEEGFHVIRFKSLFSDHPSMFLVRANTSRLDGRPASFRYGAVVGGYIEPGLSGFAAVCTDGAGSVLVRSQGNRTRGPRGAGDLRVVVENRTSGEVIIDSGTDD